MKIALLLKDKKKHNSKVINFFKLKKIDLDVFIGSRSDKIPQKLKKKKYDLIISYLSPWIISGDILKKTSLYNINFHPGPPEYPGTGCYNFALFDNVKTYGVTAHLMNAKVDTGKIIEVKRFKINKNVTLEKLINESYLAMFSVLLKIMKGYLKNQKLEFSCEKWKKKPYKRRDLEKLCILKLSDKPKILSKKIKATYFKGYPGPYYLIGKNKFEFNPDR